MNEEQSKMIEKLDAAINHNGHQNRSKSEETRACQLQSQRSFGHQAESPATQSKPHEKINPQQDPKVAEMGDVFAVPEQTEGNSADFGSLILKALGDFQIPPKNDPDELFKSRYFSKRGGIAIYAPSGIGKSTFTLGLAVSHSLGKSYLGIEPTRPLRYLIIQAENDDGDIAEMCFGVCTGLNLSNEEKEDALLRVSVARVNRYTGGAFADAMRYLIQVNRPDVVVLDPLLSFLGADVSSQKDTSVFLRNYLQPILGDFSVGLILVHHTGKPRSKDQGGITDQSYIALGSSELTNWPRAIISLQKTPTEGVFMLNAAKRGSRLHWLDINGKITYSKFIRHSKSNIMHWEEIPPSELVEIKSSPSVNTPTEDDVLALFPAEGFLSTEQIKTLFKGNGWDKNLYPQLLLSLKEKNLIALSQGERNSKRYSRTQPLPQLQETPESDSPL